MQLRLWLTDGLLQSSCSRYPTVGCAVVLTAIDFIHVRGIRTASSRSGSVAPFWPQSRSRNGGGDKLDTERGNSLILLVENSSNSPAGLAMSAVSAGFLWGWKGMADVEPFP